MNQSVTIDIAIIGGGIAGLWLLNNLKNQGYNAVLFEQTALGNDQTIASQGMIHGGVKYALGGNLSGESEAIADMPNHWQQCLQGRGDVDLTRTNILTEEFYMWSAGRLASKLTTFFASKALRGRIESLKSKNYPGVFQNSAFKGNVYKLVDLVLDVPSLLINLRDNVQDAIFSIDWQNSSLQQNNGKTTLTTNGITVNASKFILTAGKGNAELLEQLNVSLPQMQLRPLKQVIVKHRHPFMLYAHCIGASMSASPRLTISSHQCSDGATAWYLGGDLATDGASTPDDALISKAQTEINNLFPWLDWQDAQWQTLYVDRAEPLQKGLIKPDNAFAENASTDVIVAWPTKLTLAPNLAQRVNQLLQKDSITLGEAADISALSTLGTPPIAAPCWETHFS